MASARARLGAARRSTIRRQKKWKTAKGIFETAGTIASFVGTQAKKADTAWGEYEKGYEALGGTDPIKKPKLWEKGGFKSMFKGPAEGEVTINKKVYDAGQVRKAGAFLGSDAAAALSDKTRASYLERTAPGRTDAATFMGGFGSGSKTGGVGVSGGFGQGTGSIGFKGQDFTSQYTPSNLEQQQYKIEGDISQKKILDWQEAGSPIDVIDPTEIRDIDPPDYSQQQVPIQDQSQSFLQKMQQGVKQKFSDIGARDWQKSEQERIEAEKQRIFYGKNSTQIQSYKKGGSFVTNGPQMIMVGDNPGGREAVNIVPLSSKKRESKENRSLLESLYENNRRRKKY